MNISNHPPFVWPFMAGVAFLLVWLPVVYFRWLRKGKIKDFKKVISALFSVKTVRAVKEIFNECLLHRRIFRFNPRLGYMHMSLAFGWFLLIVAGKAETMLFAPKGPEPFYLPVFFKYFYPAAIPDSITGNFFLALMDLLLLFVLSGLAFAIWKRFQSRRVGMKRTTRHILPDRIALTFLWMIFPLRWLAESLSAGLARSGGFFTLGSGKVLVSLLPAEHLLMPAWWAYSIALGCFFIALPFSRYMHIFTEVVLILLKHWGLETPERDNGYGDFEISACSRCGICTNVCQLSADAAIEHSQAVYFIRDIRYSVLERETAENCFLCGRCTQACPVEIGVDQLRLAVRREIADKTSPEFELNRLGTISAKSAGFASRGEMKSSFFPENGTPKPPLLYFAGCMSHLTPGIIESVTTILEVAGLSFQLLDKKGDLCCGRPAMQAGWASQARNIIDTTSELIRRSGASLLLVSCPICYRVFREEYDLPVPVVHHTTFFSRLMRERPSLFRHSGVTMSYHDPCDLGRGSGIYEEPREVLREAGILLPLNNEKEDALCCGGSLANLAITPDRRKMVTDAAYDMLASPSPDFIVTACPLCKKSFSAGKRPVPVVDIAEIVSMHLIPEATQLTGNRKREALVAAER